MKLACEVVNRTRLSGLYLTSLAACIPSSYQETWQEVSLSIVLSEGYISSRDVPHMQVREDRNLDHEVENRDSTNTQTRDSLRSRESTYPKLGTHIHTLVTLESFQRMSRLH